MPRISTRRAGAAVAALLAGSLAVFAVVGVVPPFLVVESASMSPSIGAGEVVPVVQERGLHRPDGVNGTGVVTARLGRQRGYESHDGPGDVVLYAPNGDTETAPVPHRAMFWVERSENWYDRANPEYLGGADSCAELNHCPAPHDGFVTKGDGNSRYDQAGSLGISTVVKPEWVHGIVLPEGD